MVSILDRYLKPRDKKAGKFGIEIEVEGSWLPDEVNGDSWRTDVDGSLKGESMEYILMEPVPMDKVSRELEILYENFQDGESTINPSIRTGVHVHLNVQNYTHTQLATLFTLYYVVESLMLRYCGENRDGNLFCLGANHAPFIINELKYAFNSHDMRTLCHDNVRYAALNPKPIAYYGSVEFRALATPKDVRDVAFWVRIISDLSESALTYDNPKDVMGEFSMNTSMDFVKRTFPNTYHLFKFEEDLDGVLRRGMRNAQIIAFSQNWNKYEEYFEGKPEEKPVAEFDEFDAFINPLDLRRGDIIGRGVDGIIEGYENSVPEFEE